jgi:hypothetical protein
VEGRPMAFGHRAPCLFFLSFFLGGGGDFLFFSMTEWLDPKVYELVGGWVKPDLKFDFIRIRVRV